LTFDNKWDMTTAQDMAAQQPPPKKKAVTVKQLIAEVFIDPKVDPYLAPGIHLQCAHAVLQHKLSLIVSCLGWSVHLQPATR